jgi:hypothetical protein
MLTCGTALQDTLWMQDRYAGDVGDFMKLGLLRHLTSSHPSNEPDIRIGLNWYLAPNETANADGKHITYLDPGNRWHTALSECDSDLMCSLAEVVAGNRSVDAIEASGALPPGTVTHSEGIEPAFGIAGRAAWHGRALDKLANAATIFVDPDNGIRRERKGAKPHKFAFIDELADYADRGQNLVAYHHADRSADSRAQALRRLHELAAGVRQEPVGAIVARRGTCRFFLITATDSHPNALRGSLDAYANRWAKHAELVLP